MSARIRIGMAMAALAGGMSWAHGAPKPEIAASLQRGHVQIGRGVVREITARAQPVGRSGEMDVRVTVGDGRTLTLQRFRYRSRYFGPLCFEDYDGDGFRDLTTVAEIAGKWQSSRVWHFDQSSGRFVVDALARSLRGFSNLGFDGRHGRVVTWSIGFASPLEKYYRVRGQRLVLEEACTFDNEHDEDYLRGTVTWFRRGRVTIQRRHESSDMFQLPCQAYRSVVREPSHCLKRVSGTP